MELGKIYHGSTGDGVCGLSIVMLHRRQGVDLTVVFSIFLIASISVKGSFCSIFDFDFCDTLTSYF